MRISDWSSDVCSSDLIEALSPDPSVLAHDAEIDALIASSGAVTKGQQDLARLSEERSASGGLVARLRAEAGALASDPPTRIVSSRLREIALGQDRKSTRLNSSH